MIYVEQDRDERSLAEKLSRRIIDKCQAYLKKEGSDMPFVVALSGGSTPKPLFEYWRDHPDELLASPIHFVWVDERMVPYESDESNYGNACRLCFEPINFPRERLHPIETDKDAEASAHAYTQLIEGLAIIYGKKAPIDLAILGMGEDGHTSSLFPGQDLMDEKQRFIASVHPTNGVERVALSYHGIGDCPEAILHVTGEKKQDRLTEVVRTAKRAYFGPSKKLLPAANVFAMARKSGQTIELFTTLDPDK